MLAGCVNVTVLAGQGVGHAEGMAAVVTIVVGVLLKDFVVVEEAVAG